MLVRGQEQLRQILDEALKERWVSFDTETAGATMAWLTDKKKASMIDEYKARMVGCSVAYADKCFYIPTMHANGQNVDARGFIRELFDGAARVWAHNFKYDARVVANYLGEAIWPRSFGDTMVLAWLTGDGVPMEIDGELRYRHGLKDLTLYHFKHKMATFDETVSGQVCTTPGIQKAINELTEQLALAHQDMGQQLDMFGVAVDTKALSKEIKHYTKEINKLKKMLEFRDKQADECTPEELASYAAEDAKWTLALAKKLAPKLHAMGYVRQFDDIEMPCVRIVREMQDSGVNIDVEFFERIQKEVGEEAEKLAERWRILTGSEITSSRQSAKAVYEDLRAWQVTDASKTGKGQLSVNKKAIAFVKATTVEGSLAQQLADLKLEHSKRYKIANTYTHAIIRQIPYRTDGKLHAEINMVGTETGRFSCNSPNLQAMPKVMVRDGFVASDGCVLIDADYVGLETVIAAHYSHDPNLLEVILGGKNLHDINQQILGVDRSIAKTFWFGYQYGAQPRKLATTLNIPLVERTYDGKTFMDAPRHVYDMFEKMNESYAALIEWRQSVAEQCRVDGYVTTCTKHRRYLPQINSPDRWVRLKAERQAANAVIQGSGAGIIKAAMVRLYDKFKSTPEWQANMLLQVHDSLLVECREEHVEQVVSVVKEYMQNAVKLDVPLSVSAKWGKTWGSAK